MEPTTPKNVYQLIAEVSADLAKEGIAKDKNNDTQKFRFRGIDDVQNALAPVLAEYGLVILPRMRNRECAEKTSKNGGTLFYVTVAAEFDLVSSHDGSSHTVCLFGEAMDSGDKATNKAMAMAYKYMAIQTFCIPTEGNDDADAEAHEVMAKKDEEEIEKYRVLLLETNTFENLKQVWANVPAAYKPQLEKTKEKLKQLYGVLDTATTFINQETPVTQTV